MTGLTLSMGLSLGAGGGGGSAAPVPIASPNASFNVAPLNTITYSRIGGGTSSAFTHNYDHAAARAALSPGNTFYVDVDSGNNNNDGSVGSPVRSIDLAVAMVQATGALGCVKVKGAPLGQPRKRYTYQNSQARSGQASLNATWRDALATQWDDVDVIIEPVTPGHIFDSVYNGASVAWTATADANIWKSTAASTIMFDYATQDEYGNPRRVAVVLPQPADEAAAIAALNAAYALYGACSDDQGVTTYQAGVCCSTATTRYVRLFNNRNPNSDPDLVIQGTGARNGNFYASTKNCRLFLTGAGFIGGNSLGALYTQAVAANRFTINAADCRFAGASGYGALTLDGRDTVNGATSNTAGSDAIFLRCSASGGTDDGFNYHGTSRAVELSCIGNWDGNSTSTASNGSTLHENCLAVRLNGRYLYNSGRSIHEVASSRSWNMGCAASTLQGQNGLAHSTAYAVGVESTNGGFMWIDACRVANGPSGPPQYLTEANFGTSRIFYANLTFTPEVGPSSTPGQVLTYTP